MPIDNVIDRRSTANGASTVTHRGTSYTGALRTYPFFSPRGGLDRIYYRGPMRAFNAHTCRLRLSKVASDHLPVIADFDLH